MNPGCEKCKYKDMNPRKEPCVNCWVFDERPNFEQRPTTNYDLLISKTPEELAEWVTTKGRTFGEEYEGYMSVLDWLKSPVR